MPGFGVPDQIAGPLVHIVLPLYEESAEKTGGTLGVIWREAGRTKVS
jgi:hypothetical protein